MPTVRYWAGARRAAGRAQEDLAVATLGELRAGLATRPGLAAVLAVASVLVDGEQPTAGDDTRLAGDAVVDILPPFAGG